MSLTLALTGSQHRQLMEHLYPGDGKEAVAVAVCGRHHGIEHHRLLVQEIIPVPYDACRERRPDRVCWPPDGLTPFLQHCMDRNLALVKFHSHPAGVGRFSGHDDKSDHDLYTSVFGWCDDGLPHASVIVLPDGSLTGRGILPDMAFAPLQRITVVGDEIRNYDQELSTGTIKAFGMRVEQAFGPGTFRELQRLSVAVVGCSGTGSLVVEQLVRTGVGHVVLLDPKRIGEKNHNRIINARRCHFDEQPFKVHLLEDAINQMGLGTQVSALPMDLFTPEAVRAIADCDVVFGCMDTAEGRHLLNRLATFYLIPYFDVGVKLQADGRGGVSDVCGAIHYLQPGGSSLLSRGVYTLEDVRADALYRTDPETYAEHRRVGYIRGVNVDSPAVMPVNMVFAGLAVTELLARLHGFRFEEGSDYAVHGLSLNKGIYYHRDDGAPCELLAKHVGRGDITPLLDLPQFSDNRETA